MAMRRSLVRLLGLTIITSWGLTIAPEAASQTRGAPRRDSESLSWEFCVFLCNVGMAACMDQCGSGNYLCYGGCVAGGTLCTAGCGLPEPESPPES